MKLLKDEYVIVGGHFDHLGMGGIIKQGKVIQLQFITELMIMPPVWVQ